MRFSRAAVPLLSVLLTGCGYVHFGRLPPQRTGDAALQQAYASLAVEKKILQQELELARKEKDTLRQALERAGAPTTAGTKDLAQQLETTTRELATLRANYAKLQLERSTTAEAANALAPANAAKLEEENGRLHRELDAARRENATLAERLTTSVAQNEQAQAALEQLNSELLNQKQARERAEQATVALRAQLAAVMARAGRAEATDARQDAAPAPANPLAALQNAKEPPSGAAPAVELRTSLQRVRAMAAAKAAEAPAPPSNESTGDIAVTPAHLPPPSPRTYTVQPGDTLEKIAAKVYGAADQWGKIYAANADALGSSQGLKPGMKLQVPDK